MTEMQIPAEVRNDPAWVNVKKDSKIPWQSSKYKAASPSSALTWSEFGLAINGMYSGKYDGIGYCFHDNGIIGIDIDAGFDEDGFLSDLAVDIINACKSYTELSRSGRGVHILVKGNLPFNGANNRNGVEIYKTGRYFIMTGKQLIYTDINNCQDAIDYIVNKYFPTEPKQSAERIRKEAVYRPLQRFSGGKVITVYPEIAEGCRNLSLLSYAGQLHTRGCSAEEILAELCKVNEAACHPALEKSEIESIVKSIMRYER